MKCLQKTFPIFIDLDIFLLSIRIRQSVRKEALKHSSRPSKRQKSTSLSMIEFNKLLSKAEKTDRYALLIDFGVSKKI